MSTLARDGKGKFNIPKPRKSSSFDGVRFCQISEGGGPPVKMPTEKQDTFFHSSTPE